MRWLCLSASPSLLMPPFLPFLLLPPPPPTPSLDLEGFKKGSADQRSGGPGGTALKDSDVKFSCTAMTPHIGEYLEFRVVGRGNRLQAKAVYFGVQSPDFSFYLHRIVPKVN